MRRVVLLLVAGVLLFWAIDSTIGSESSGPEFGADRTWADEKIKLLGVKPTTGALYTSRDRQVGSQISSGDSGAQFDLAHRYLVETGRLLPNSGKQVAGHAEPKAAALMRSSGITYAVFVINHTDPGGEGFCSWASGIGCAQAVSLILPSGSALELWWPNGGPHKVQGGAAAR